LNVSDVQFKQGVDTTEEVTVPIETPYKMKITKETKRYRHDDDSNQYGSMMQTEDDSSEEQTEESDWWSEERHESVYAVGENQRQATSPSSNATVSTPRFSPFDGPNSPPQTAHDAFLHLMRRGRVHFLNGKYKECFQTMQTVFEENFELASSEKVSVLYNQAMSLYEEQEFVWCLNVVHKTLALDPKHAMSLELKGDIHMQLMEFKEGENAYRQCLKYSGARSRVVLLKKNESKFKVLKHKVSKCLAILGLDPDTKDEHSSTSLRSQYRKVCRSIHPDRFCESAPFLQVLAEKRFKRIQKAYSFLKEQYTEAEQFTAPGQKFELLVFQRVAAHSPPKGEVCVVLEDTQFVQEDFHMQHDGEEEDHVEADEYSYINS